VREFVYETPYKRLAIRGWDRSSMYLLGAKRGAEVRNYRGKKSFRKTGSSTVILQGNTSWGGVVMSENSWQTSN
jgi:hypothetical protein